MGLHQGQARGRGRSLLMASARRGDLARVRWLLGRGANANAQTDLGETALMEACQMGHLGIVRELLGNGADVNAAEADGKTALSCGCAWMRPWRLCASCWGTLP